MRKYIQSKKKFAKKKLALSVFAIMAVLYIISMFFVASKGTPEHLDGKNDLAEEQDRLKGYRLVSVSLPQGY